VIAENHELSRQLLAQGIFHDEPQAGVEFGRHQYVPGSLKLDSIETPVVLSAVKAIGYPQADVPNQEDENQTKQRNNYAHDRFRKSSMVFSIVKSCIIDYIPDNND
jgi:hypothetical protein